MKVLMIAYQSPPIGGSGVQRTAKFAKYLPDFSWETVILTRDDNMQLKDMSLLEDVKKAVIYRTKAHDYSQWPGKLSLIGKGIRKYLSVPDGDRIWQIASLKKAKEIVKKENIDLIYSTSTPYSDHLLGLKLKKIFPNIPWVADFRDEWTNNPYILDNPHNFIRTKMEKRMEENVVRYADAVVINTPVMRENFIKMYPFIEDKSYVIPNGYDSDDFKDLDNNSNNQKFTMAYAGLLYGRRKPDSFLQALGELIKEGKIEEDKTEVIFIGNYKEEQFKETLRKYGVENCCVIKGYMPHRKCLEELAQSDVLLLIEGTGPGANAFYTGKIFDYMKVGKPVLGILPAKGAAAQLLEETKIGIACDYNNISEIKAGIMELYEKRNLEFNPDNDKINKFERKNLTEQLVYIFNSVGGK